MPQIDKKFHTMSVNETRTAADVIVPAKAKAEPGEGVNFVLVHDLDADVYGTLRLQFLDGNGNGFPQSWTDDGTPGSKMAPGTTAGHGLGSGDPFRITKVKEGVAPADEEEVMLVCFSKSGTYKFSDCL